MAGRRDAWAGRPPSQNLGQLHHPAPDRRGRARDRDQHDHVRDLLPDAAAGRRHPGDAGHPLRGVVRRPTRPSSRPPSGSASTTPCRCSTGTGSRASSAAPRSTSAPAWRSARRPAWATPSATRTRSCRRILHRFPVTLSLAVGAAMIWLPFGLAPGCLRAQARVLVRPRRDGSPWPGLLPIFWTGLVSLAFFSYNSAGHHRAS